METFDLLAQGLLSALQVHNLIYALIGVTLGTAVGVLPGIGPALTVDSLLLARIDVPVLVQFGDADAVFPPPAADLQAARYLGSPEVTTSTIADASHYPVLEANHDQVVADVDAWLDARAG